MGMVVCDMKAWSREPCAERKASGKAGQRLGGMHSRIGIFVCRLEDRGGIS